MKILDSKTKRNSLGEGRTQELGYAFAKYTKNGDIQLVMPITTCKDYLNDVVFAEKFKKDSAPIYGFKHKYQKLFEESKPLIVIDLLNNMGNSWYEYDKYKKLFDDSQVYELVQKFIHSIESYLNFELTEFKFVEDKWVVEFDSRWVSDNYMISLYTLLYRIQLNYCRTTMEVLTDFSKIPSNVLYSKAKFNNALDVIRDGKNKPYITEDMNISLVHNQGFQKYNFI